jgi:tagatose-1,6-bisphosphate aldolase
MAGVAPSVDKARRLRRCTDEAGRAVMLAADQRASLRRLLDPAHPARVAASVLVEFKVELTRVLGSSATAVLLDPEFGAPQVIDAGALPGATGLVLALEATGYEGSPRDRRSRMLPGWSPRRAAELGASAAKVLVHYHPEAPGAHEQERLIATVAEACAAVELPLIVEPLSFPLDGRPVDAGERRRVVVETARRLTALDGVDVLKAEFPTGDDAADWADACEELSGASRVPWVLLSAGVDFERFALRARVACAAGASGVLVGRAVWNEAVPLRASDRRRFLETVGVERLERLTEIVRTNARTGLAIDLRRPADRSLGTAGPGSG